MLLLCLPLAAEQKVRVACVGNSVTYGYGLPDRERNAYPACLQRLLGDHYDVRNFGHSGTTLLRRGHRPYVAQQEFREALAFRPDVVVIHLGLNDTDPRNWPNFRDDFDADYRALIDSFRAVNPEADLWICRLSPIGSRHARFESGTRDWYWQIQEAIDRVARANRVGLIDLCQPLYSRPDLFPDALHPNVEGAQIIAETVYAGITGNYGALRVSDYYGNGMVLQRDRPLRFCGTAIAGCRVEVTFDGEKQTAVAGADGRWEIVLPARSAGGPYEASIVCGDEGYFYDDVWVGEVWVCSGQSNMEYALKQTTTAAADLAAADDPRLHLFLTDARFRTDAVEWDSMALEAVNRLDYLHRGRWQRSTAATAADFSAVAYHFGRMLADSLGVHVGLICNAVGGSTTESWVSRKTLEFQYPAILRDFYRNDHSMAWARERAALNVRRSKNPLQRHPYEPAYLFEAAVRPLRDYDFRGVLWYQGESNAHNVELHARLFALLETSWREYLGRPDLPFYFVQLSSLNRPSWPHFRDSQRQLAATLPATWMAVSSDVGDSTDVHYPDKRPVGRRLALQALRHTYGHTQLTSAGPEVLSCRREKGRLRLRFANAEGMTVSRGFEVAGADGIFRPARAQVKGSDIVVWADGVEPVAVRYGWEPFTRADLRNRQGLPASTFRLTAE